jgi:hypothetical protein
MGAGPGVGAGAALAEENAPQSALAAEASAAAEAPPDGRGFDGSKSKRPPAGAEGGLAGAEVEGLKKSSSPPAGLDRR